MEYRLLVAFRKLFDGQKYRHRVSNQGDEIAMHLYEDLVLLGRSSKLTRGVKRAQRVVNLANRIHGIRSRRGDATFGSIVPGEPARRERGFDVMRGMLATVEIGIEVKILAKAMIKQIDRVINDLNNQARQFRRGGANAITVGVVGVNWAEQAVAYEGDRAYATDGRKNPHPIQEAAEAERRLREFAAPDFDHFLVLRYKATNVIPYPFEWLDRRSAERDYGAMLSRLSQQFDQRF